MNVGPNPTRAHKAALFVVYVQRLKCIQEHPHPGGPGEDEQLSHATEAVDHAASELEDHLRKHGPANANEMGAVTFDVTMFGTNLIVEVTEEDGSVFFIFKDGRIVWPVGEEPWANEDPREEHDPDRVSDDGV